ncbi:MAG: histidine kinase [Reichenbachiella sp.]|uniref:sensor histidine kinase n=1 Tax=Reichenbachiella sp. TaxID=2184521 RepID=UPI0032659355
MLSVKRFIKAYFDRLPLSGVTIGLIVLGVSTFQLTQQYAYHVANEFDFQFSWVTIAIKQFIGNLIWAMLAPLLFRTGQQLSKWSGILNWIHVRFILKVSLIAVSQNTLALWLYNFSYYLQSGYMRDFFGSNNRSELITGSFTSLIEALVIIGVFMAIDYQKKLANKERDLAKAELDALKMQLHPHFIFNTLHSISSMIDIDVKKAQRMITKVGDLLRSMLARDEGEYVTLQEEMKFIRNYLELEEIRFQDRMELSFAIEEQVITGKVPALILQPLVENCIKHGVAKSTGLSKIEVCASLFKNGSMQPWLKLEINNSDELELSSIGTKGFGIGLRNVEMRLEQNYGQKYFCRFEKLDANNYKSEIRIPFDT